MGVLARTDAASIEAALAALPGDPVGWTRLRGPEIGMTMVRGRMGGDGAEFNLGEMTMTRASVRLACGTVGHAFRAGRDLRAAELSAVADALLQGAAHAVLMDRLVAPQAAGQAARRADRAARAAATRVDFFGMARMG
jgi:alpha-D-ribose 1-methylphosphonate 5-triphosphate synthase subunit PhnG